MEEQVRRIIQAEVTRRVEARVTQVLEVVSRQYDVSLPRLMKDYSELEAREDEGGKKQCLGLVGKGGRCTRSAREDGYCKSHTKQAPVARAVAAPAAPVAGPVHVAVQHTHTMPPLFLDGCPACEHQKRNRLNI
jgi:hypothetical protein